MTEQKKKVSPVTCDKKYVKLIQEGTLEAIISVRRKFDDEGLKVLEYRGKMEAKVATLKKRLKTFEFGVKITPIFAALVTFLGCLCGFYPALFSAIMLLSALGFFALSLATSNERVPYFMILGVLFSWVAYLGPSFVFESVALFFSRREGHAFFLVFLFFLTQNMYSLGHTYLSLSEYLRSKETEPIVNNRPSIDGNVGHLHDLLCQALDVEPVAARDVLGYLKEADAYFQKWSVLSLNFNLRRAGFKSAGGAHKKNLFWYLKPKNGDTITQNGTKGAVESFLREKAPSNSK